MAGLGPGCITGLGADRVDMAGRGAVAGLGGGGARTGVTGALATGAAGLVMVMPACGVKPLTPLTLVSMTL